MGDFIRSGRFKVLLAVAVLLFFFLLRSIYTGGFMPFFSRLGSLIMAPVSRASAFVSGVVEDNFYPYLHAEELMEENELLREENRQLEERLADYQALKNENDQFREFLEIKEENPSLVFQPATVIGRTPDSPFGSFTINVGSYHGISPRDAVITADGLVGVVSEVNYTYSNVQTILDVAVSIGGVDIFTLDTGVVSGAIDLSIQGRCRMNYLSRESSAAVGDVVHTSGVGGQMPPGLVIGAIEAIEAEGSGLSLYAVIRPAADISRVKTVQVITSFGGQEPAVEEAP